jgi:hypothetical protein
MIELECPWCGAAVALGEPVLPAELRCDACATLVDVADGDAAERRLAA